MHAFPGRGAEGAIRPRSSLQGVRDRCDWSRWSCGAGLSSYRVCTAPVVVTERAGRRRLPPSRSQRLVACRANAVARSVPWKLATLVPPTPIGSSAPSGYSRFGSRTSSLAARWRIGGIRKAADATTRWRRVASAVASTGRWTAAQIDPSRAICPDVPKSQESDSSHADRRVAVQPSESRRSRASRYRRTSSFDRSLTNSRCSQRLSLIAASYLSRSTP